MTDGCYTSRLHDAGHGNPLLVVLHGTGGDQNSLFAFGRRLLPKASVLAPCGDRIAKAGLCFFTRTPAGEHDPADLKRATGKMSRLVNECAIATGSTRIFGLGFSNGANLLANLLAEETDLFDAAVLMHPVVTFPLADEARLDGKRVLMTAGRMDELAPAELTERLERYFRMRSAEIDLVWHEGGHEIRRGEIEAVRTFLGKAAAR